MCIFRLKTYISSLKICISKLEIKHATGNRPLDKETKHEILLFRIQIPVNDKPLVMDIIQRRQALSAGCFKVQPPIRASDILSGTLSVALQDDRQICRYMIIIRIIIVVPGRVRKRSRGFHSRRSQFSSQDYGTIQQCCNIRIVRSLFQTKIHRICQFNAVAVFPFTVEHNIRPRLLPHLHLFPVNADRHLSAPGRITQIECGAYGLFRRNLQLHTLAFRKIRFHAHTHPPLFPVQYGRNEKVHIQSFTVMIVDALSIFGMTLKPASYTAPERLVGSAVYLVRSGFQRKEIGYHARCGILLAQYSSRTDGG